MNATEALRYLVFAIPGDIQTLSGGYGYDRKMMAALPTLGWTVEHLQLPSSFPRPSRVDLERAASQLAAVPDGSLVLVDGLAFGAMPNIARHEARRLRLVALVHHPLALETGLSMQEINSLRASEIEALAFTRGVVVTSPETARTLVADFSVMREVICIAVPGTAGTEKAVGSAADEPLVILAVGSLTARKDHATLVRALARIADRPWRCRIVGSDRMDIASAEALRRQVAESGLEMRIEIAGAREDVAAEYDRADIFALASRYEGYGMVFAEAMARGLPIVGCRGGAIPDLVPEKAGILVDAGDVDAFSGALATLIDDQQARKDYAAGSLEAGRSLPDWPDSAGILSDYLEGIR